MMPKPATPQHPEVVELDEYDRLRKVSQIRHRLSQFVNAFETTEPWWRFDAAVDRWEDAPRGWHTVQMPPLLEQVRLASEGTNGASDSTGGYESRPAAALDAIDVEIRIEVQCATFLRGTGKAQHGGLEANLRLMSARMPTLTDKDIAEAQKLVRTWWVAAKIVAGLEERPQTPHIHCPLCDHVDTIRVRLDATSVTGIAWCKDCGEAWDEENIGLLIAEIERRREIEESEDDDNDG
jgi:hypothetical protein